MAEEGPEYLSLAEKVRAEFGRPFVGEVRPRERGGWSIECESVMRNRNKPGEGREININFDPGNLVGGLSIELSGEGKLRIPAGDLPIFLEALQKIQEAAQQAGTSK